MGSLEELNMLCEEANGLDEEYLDEEYLDEGWFGDRLNDAKRFIKKHGTKIRIIAYLVIMTVTTVILAKKLIKLKVDTKATEESIKKHEKHAKESYKDMEDAIKERDLMTEREKQAEREVVKTSEELLPLLLKKQKVLKREIDDYERLSNNQFSGLSHSERAKAERKIREVSKKLVVLATQISKLKEVVGKA